MFLESLAASSIILASSGAQPGWCQASGDVQVRVGLVATQPVGDFSKTMANLKTVQIDTKNPYGAHVDTHVGGLTSSTVGVEQQMSLGGVRYGDESCVWYKDVRVTIKLAQRVYVARDYKPGTCMHAAVWEHEHKHVRVDREVINKYRPIYDQAVRKYLHQARILGPFPHREEKRAQDAMMKTLGQVIAQVTEKMESERMRRQQAVDTRAEYDRVTALCQGKR